MDTPVKIESALVERLDNHKSRLGLTRQRLTNNLLRAALGYLDKKGYDSAMSLLGVANEMVQAHEQRS